MVTPRICPGSYAFDFSDTCVRGAWSAFTPSAFVLLLLVIRIPLQKRIKKITTFIKSPFQQLLTLDDALEVNIGPEGEIDALTTKRLPATWVTIALTTIALLEAVVWLSVGAYRIAAESGSERRWWDASRAAIAAFSWIYAATRPLTHPKPTPPYDLFTLYIIHLSVGILEFGGIYFDHNIYGEPLPGTLVIVSRALNLGAILVLLVVVFSLPMNVPSEKVNIEDIGKSVSPEDYTSLWGWTSFHWVYPLISRGTYTTLNEPDVWALSPTMQSRPLFIAFSRITRGSLLRRLLAANSLDITLDFVLTIVSVSFNYLGPFFLKRILDAIDNPTPANRSEAYIFACLAFLSTVCKAEADLLHLWHGRRAACRIRSELMASIYDKALKRKDFSGVVDKDKDKNSNSKESEKANDPKAGANIGKIVNMMSGDVTQVSAIALNVYLIYSAPIEIIIASTFLYQLLGISAFAGFLVLILGLPLNSFIARRSIRIQKGVMAARDKRMAVLNELIGAVKFIKFFAWEDRWIQRALDARKYELTWLEKGNINSVMLQTLWIVAPILVSIISFFAFVMQGKELTVGIAFTAITLFTMIRQPFNVVPTWIVQILTARVALNRIDVFLNEDEVTDQVSSMKQAVSGSKTLRYDVFGLKNASFRWNSVKDKEEDAKDAKGKKDSSEIGAKNGTAATVQQSADDAGDSAPSTEQVRFELKDLSVIFPEGQLTVVTGPTASGKTALLLALLGEMTLLPGGEIIMTKDHSKVNSDGLMHAVSYAAQLPWLQHQSIKDNILFGFPYEEERYKEVVECCALFPDLEILEDGDATEIGARGVNLSGGQKARVALARAAYARTKYILLDDPLSAVDSHTTRFLFDRLFLGPLMKGRTVILVTHHVDVVMPATHYLVRMLDGRIDTQGTVKELRERGVLEEITQDSALEVQEKVKKSKGDDQEKINEGEDNVTKPPEGQTKKPRKLVKDEEREAGHVKWPIYKTYLNASSYWTWAILVALIAITQLLSIGERAWFMVWGEAYGNTTEVTSNSYVISAFATHDQDILYPFSAASAQSLPHPHRIADATKFPGKLPSAQDHPLFYVGVYALIGMATAIVRLISSITQFVGALRASRKLFRQLLTAVMRATMRWHDVTPTGRMLNRFSKDMETIDFSLAKNLQAVNFSLANFLSSVVVVVFVFPWFVIPAIVIGMLYYRLAIGYLNTGPDLRRMENISRSPIYSGFGELLEGIVTVRAFSAEQRFLDVLHKRIDLTTLMWYSFWMTSRWLLLNFDCIGGLAVFMTTLFALGGFVRAGVAGLVITSAMAFTSNVFWACTSWTQLELDLNAVERVVEYINLPQEPPLTIPESQPPAAWPTASETTPLVVVEDLVVKYAPELPAVLHGVSFELMGRERVGLLGRTGSGKSTLAMSLLRFADPTSGKIIVDGIDITTIGVHDLRSRITFIPQDASLFSGTLRENLDPFNDHTDIECLDVLHRVQMLTDQQYNSQKSSRYASRASSIRGVEREDTDETATSSLTGSTEIDSKTSISLDTQVSAGGANFSQGQRQLIAMARALLRHSSIIVLDEATSSIDFVTDAKIQKTIREEFNNSLLLTVAHRLRTVIDYDRLIVLDKGTVAEFDTPHNLIQKDNGIFRSMCLQSGTFTELEEAARAKAGL
ncbi:multidrug resistance-associated ABC transporter [Rickenella mellea]|uniref:Multidrug resistance-associated ABC transporter n=1 Tax=Rickenella mellea TaxID=50990 RepID=A0A4Y7Q2W4_9AGAM|nr:multidrug resistance-associated ABC transporter [Rickenella mellea]